MTFEWDPWKAAANAVKHGVAFEDAAEVFLDPRALDGADEAHSSTEPRWLRLGRAPDGRVLMVAYTRRRRGDEESIHIISARQASRRERQAYRARD
jgi:uncharacterized DUF497 family protein